jgi:hypothetical protein
MPLIEGVGNVEEFDDGFPLWNNQTEQLTSGLKHARYSYHVQTAATSPFDSSFVER